MTTDPESKARPVGRFRIGLLSLLQVVFVILTFLAINFLSSQFHRPFDLSDDLNFTLAPSTTRYLASEAITGREDPIDIIVAFPANHQIYPRVRPVAEEIARLAGGKVRLRMIDPMRASDMAETLSAEYGIVFRNGMVIIDARSAAERAEPGANQGSPHVNIVKDDDMVVYDRGPNNERKIRGFLIENALRAGLVSAIEGKPKVMWVLSDKSDLSAEGSDIWAVLSSNLVSQNIIPERVPMAGIRGIPEEVDAVAIIAPSYDLTSDEIGILESYWNRPRSSILVTIGAKPVPPRLRAFLRKNGITPRQDRVLTVDGGVVQTTVPARFTSGNEFTRDLWEKVTTFEGATQSLDVREGANDLMANGITPLLLLEAWPTFWGETRFPADKVEFDNREDHPGPLALAAAVIRGAPNDEEVAGQVSKMLVISNTAFLESKNVWKENLDFLASGANWMVGRDELSGEGPRGLRRYKLPLLEPQVTFINRVNLLFLPGLALLIGAIVWSSRRS